MHLSLFLLGVLACDREEPDVEPTIPAVRIHGEVTWTLAFDEVAEAAGAYDCSYTRTYDGLQFLDRPWTCVDCDVVTEGEAVMTDGEDCYAQISEDPGSRAETWGFGSGGFYRSGTTQYPLWDPLATYTDEGEGSTHAIAWSSEYDVEEGALVLSASGTFTYETDDDLLLEDPLAPRQTDYECGWPRDDPGDLTLDYTLGQGETFPNLKLTDQCGEEVLLWDLYGHWLIIDGTQPDCGPCQSMADSAPAFVAEMAEEGIDVIMVSLMGAGLATPWETPEPSTVDSWVAAWELEEPVLADEGAAYSLLPDYVGRDNFGWPAWVIVNPEMELVYGQVGFGDWESAAEVIRSLR